MTKNELREKIEKEYKMLRDWSKADRCRGGRMYYDLSDGEVWSECLIDNINDSISFRSESIDNFELFYFNTVKEAVEYMYNFMIERFNYED